MDRIKKKPQAFTTLSKIIELNRTNSPDIPGLTIADMTSSIIGSKKNSLHLSHNPLNGNSLY